MLSSDLTKVHPIAGLEAEVIAQGRAFAWFDLVFCSVYPLSDGPPSDSVCRVSLKCWPSGVLKVA